MREETAMGKQHGAIFQPELIKLMKLLLDEAAATLPGSKRTSSIMAQIASRILACAAEGERDPNRLKVAAMSAAAECSHNLRDISAERLVV